MAKLVYTKQEAAEQLKVDIRMVDQWLHRPHRPIPHFRQSRKYLIPVALLEEWTKKEAEEQMASMGADASKARHARRGRRRRKA